MSLPNLPPIRFTELLIPCAAPLRAGPADEVTLDRPREAFDVASEAVSFPFAAVFEAACVASEVVEACRRAERCATTRCCRNINREGADDMVANSSHRNTGSSKKDSLLVRAVARIRIVVCCRKVEGALAGSDEASSQKAFHWLDVLRESIRDSDAL